MGLPRAFQEHSISEGIRFVGGEPFRESPARPS
jgi:hypothetical protein